MKCCLLLFYITTSNFSDCDLWWKVDFMTTSNISSWTEKKLQSTFQSETCTKTGHGHCLVVCCWSDPLQLSGAQQNITSEKHAQQIDEMHQKLQCLQLVLVNRIGPFFSMTMPNFTAHNQRFKTWKKWATKFGIICHIHLTSCQPTTISSSISTTFCTGNTSITSRRQKMLSKSSLNPEAWILMLQEQTNLFLFAKCVDCNGSCFD